jgi:hypothetical protein
MESGRANRRVFASHTTRHGLCRPLPDVEHFHENNVCKWVLYPLPTRTYTYLVPEAWKILYAREVR